MPARWVCLGWWIAVLVLSSPAHALDGAKRESPPLVGPQVQLSPEQLAAIRAKRDADPSVRRPPVADLRAAKPTGPLPAQADRPFPNVALSSAPARQKTIVWPSLGPIPRPSWTEPWLPKKPADVTISRPLPPATGAGLAPGAGAARGSR
jgi:hypothetical protein